MYVESIERRMPIKMDRKMVGMCRSIWEGEGMLEVFIAGKSDFV